MTTKITEKQCSQCGDIEIGQRIELDESDKCVKCGRQYHKTSSEWGDVICGHVNIDPSGHCMVCNRLVVIITPEIERHNELMAKFDKIISHLGIEND